jgi:AraC-like DNA-binding protein
MKYTGNQNQVLFVGAIVPERAYMFKEELKTGLSVIWNTKDKADFFIDNQKIRLGKNCILFLTEFHRVTKYDFKELNIIQFNRDFYCIEQNDNDLGCKGLLFFGASSIPKIIIPQKSFQHFSMLWQIMMMEMEENDDYKMEMLGALLKRFLILCARIYRQKNFNIIQDDAGIGIIREYNFLVEQHYKKYTKVSDYARLLFKSPKTISNIFKKYIDKTPLQIINERRLIEAKRKLLYTDEPVNIIADELGFTDIQAFSNFFKKSTRLSPLKFRTKRK